MKVYAIQHQVEGRWTRKGIGGERMLRERGANGQVFRPVITNGRMDARSEMLLHNRFPEDVDALDRAQAALVMRGYLGHDVRMVEIVVLNADAIRKHRDPPDPWWATARAIAAEGLPAVEDDRIVRFIGDWRPNRTNDNNAEGIECTREEAESVIAWAETLPGWASTYRPERVKHRPPRGPGQSRGRARVRRWIGWTGYQLRIEDAA